MHMVWPSFMWSHYWRFILTFCTHLLLFPVDKSRWWSEFGLVLKTCSQQIKYISLFVSKFNWINESIWQKIICNFRYQKATNIYNELFSPSWPLCCCNFLTVLFPRLWTRQWKNVWLSFCKETWYLFFYYFFFQINFPLSTTVLLWYKKSDWLTVWFPRLWTRQWKNAWLPSCTITSVVVFP